MGSSTITVDLRQPAGSDNRAWLALRVALWPDGSEAEHLSAMANVLARGEYVCLAVTANWAPNQGLSELASDALLANTASHAAHRALGFAATERVVCCLRAL